MKILLLIIFLAQLNYSFAGNKEGGNGGDGIYIDGKIYLLDFIEAGIERDAYIDPELQADSEINSYLEASVGHISDMPTSLLGSKFMEIKMVL